MATVLLDTSVASLFLPARHERPERALYAPHLSGQTLALSFQSVAELWKMAERNDWGEARRKGLDGFIRRFLIIPYDYQLTKVWAQVMVGAERKGRRLETADGWIAATAVHRSLPLYAHDSDFIGVNLPGFQLITFLKT
jgi:predicted nucleic acid-binding protein